MIVLGIDPGTRRMGYGIIKKEGSRLLYIDAGLIRIQENQDTAALVETKIHLQELIDYYSPEVLAIERLYVTNNQKTAMAVAEARGVVRMVAKECGMHIKEYTPSQVKLGVTGYGKADKTAIQKMVRLLLLMPQFNVVDDVTDALALAIMGAREHG